MKHKATPKNLALVMVRLSAFAVSGDAEQQRAFCESVNKYLDDLAAEDAFGTEAQLDPRGDQRD